MSDIILNNVELGDTGSESRDKINQNTVSLRNGINNVDLKHDNLDKQNLKKTNVSQILGNTTDKVPSEKAIVTALVDYAKISDVTISMINKGTVPNIVSLPNNATKGDAYYVESEGYIYQYDGTIWNKTSFTVFPSDVIRKGDLAQNIGTDTDIAISQAGVKNSILNVEGIIDNSSGGSGSNIFDSSDVVSGKYLNGKSSGAETTASGVSYNRTYVAVKANTVYSTDLNIELETCIVFYDSAKNFISYAGKGVNSPLGTFTTPINCAFIRYNFLNTEGTTGYYIKDGDSNVGLVISIPIEKLNNAKTSGGSGNNIFDSSDVVLNKYLNGKTSGAETAASGVSYNRAYVAVKANTTYITDLNIELQSAIMFYDANKSFISYAGKDLSSPLGYFTTPANCVYIRYNFLTSEGTTGYTIIESNSGTPVGGVYFDNLYIKEDNIIKNSSPSSYQINMRNTNTFVGGMNKVIDALLTKKPRAKFVFITHFTEDWQGKETSKSLINTQIKLSKYWCADILVLSDKLHLVNRDGINNLHAIIPDDLHPGVDSSGETVYRITKFCTSFLYPIFGDDWTGKKIAWYGTSIPYGHPNPSLYAYPPKVANALGATCQNYSVSGSVVRLSTTSGGGIGGRHSFLDTNQAINYISKMTDLIGTVNEPDLFVFDYGINDFGLDKTDFNI